jgi:hypothetical protein
MTIGSLRGLSMNQALPSTDRLSQIGTHWSDLVQARDGPMPVLTAALVEFAR